MIFRIIVLVSLAFACVAILLIIAESFSPGFSGPVTCTLSQGILGLIPLSEEAKPRLPAQCLPEQRVERVIIDVATNKELAERLAGYIDSCWQTAQQGKAGKNILCYEAYSQRTTSEQSITAAMREHGICARISNNKIDSSGTDENCGDKNSVFVSAGSLTGTIIIKYESNFQRISVS